MILCSYELIVSEQAARLFLRALQISPSPNQASTAITRAKNSTINRFRGAIDPSLEPAAPGRGYQIACDLDRSNGLLDAFEGTNFKHTESRNGQHYGQGHRQRHERLVIPLTGKGPHEGSQSCLYAAKDRRRLAGRLRED